MGKIHVRSKKNFKTSRSAWVDIASKTGLRAGNQTAMHTSTEWRWETR